MTTSTVATTTARTVDQFLDSVCEGAGVSSDLLAPDAVLDATVPGWRFVVRGAGAVARQYSGWFAEPGAFDELERLPVDGGELVTYLLTWVENGVRHAAHHCHLFRFDAAGLIVADRFFCGGRWDAGRLAEMVAAREGLSDAG